MAEPAGSGTNSDFALPTTWARKPPAWNWAQATAAAGSSETSTRVLDRLGVGPGCTVLINGATGSVGTAAVQLAHARGAKVIGIAGPTNQDYVRSLGATPTLYGNGLTDRIRKIAPTGVDAVFDCAGGARPDPIATTGHPARVMTIADTSAPRHGIHLSHGAPPRLTGFRGGDAGFEGCLPGAVLTNLVHVSEERVAAAAFTVPGPDHPASLTRLGHVGACTGTAFEEAFGTQSFLSLLDYVRACAVKPTGTQEHWWRPGQR
ncbi:zinc-binding dehydrogenase [Streptomyces tauricus]|uniref:Zinc-binding dehydrogenase n=1 Tax=Streptomyces tauricus TaxID=68274 RepID=A0ABZ1JUA8_9ACTN|nr:zinc-binding dehydrogenase [Streptomyces tauricus]